VYTFILRGISLLGIDSVYCPNPLRGVFWERIASDLKPKLQEMVYAETTEDIERNPGLGRI
jgi:hypothetical protein